MQNRHQLILIITLILLLGFSAVSILMFRTSKQAIHDSIVINELPLTGDSIYSETQKDLINSINISAMMASDTFVKDWVLDGEKEEQSIKQYLQEIMQVNHAITSFFISENTHSYYSATAATQKMQADAKNDPWYLRVKSMAVPYELNVDQNARDNNRLTIFVNYRVLDKNKKFIGITGIGMNYDSTQNILKNYEKRFNRKVYFVDTAGKIVLASREDRQLGANVNSLAGINQINFDANNTKTQTYSYMLDDKQHLVNVRYINEMKWFLFVEKNETDAIANITQSLYHNLLLCLIVTALVVALTNITLKRYHLAVESAAAIDKLTNLPNRKAFDIGMSVLLHDSQRNNTSLGIIMLDLDHFKVVNDVHGHLAGDYVLAATAETLRSTIRSEDFICRWGGEEFLIVVRNCDAQHLLLLAEKIRKAVETADYLYKTTHVKITASLGTALRIDDEEVNQLINRADKALYSAKHAGRNQTILAS